MIKWIRPSGAIIETNEEKATIEHCEAQKWKRMDDPTPDNPETSNDAPKNITRFGKKKG